MSKVDGNCCSKVHCSLMSNRRLVRGVVTGIPVRISTDEVKENVKNVKISEVKRLKANRNGIKTDSLSVLIIFDKDRLPEKIFIGYMCYGVSLYVPPRSTPKMFQVSKIE